MRTSRVPTASAPGARAASEWAAATLNAQGRAKPQRASDAVTPVAPVGGEGSTSAADHVR
ncbi:MAG: hypothetical protein ABWY11_11625 [Umezawaea sp.]